jgi:hypothetical protein
VLIREHFNALIDALAGMDENGERIPGVADLILTGIAASYTLADLFAGLGDGSAMQYIKAGIDNYSVKGYLQYLATRLADKLEGSRIEATAQMLENGKAPTVSVRMDGQGEDKTVRFDFGIPEGKEGKEGPQGIPGEKGEKGDPGIVELADELGDSESMALSQKATTREIQKVKNDSSNALKGSVTGEAVRMDDVSPLPHEMAVKVSGVDDPSAVKVLAQGKNMANIYGFSAESIKGQDGVRKLSNIYGTTISTTEPSNYVEITQTATGNASSPTSYQNGFFFIGLPRKPLDGEQVTLSFDVNITNNPLNVDSLTPFVNDVNLGWATITNGRCIKSFTYSAGTTGRQSIEVRVCGCSMVVSNIQLELGGVDTGYEHATAPTEHTVNADGTVTGVTSLSPTTTLMTDTEGAVITAEYNRDLNKAFDEIVNAIISLGGNV